MKTIDKVDMKPILFSTPMVKAILDDKKTQTRRVIKDLLGVALDAIKHPYQPGQVLWVQETWQDLSDDEGEYVYLADGNEGLSEKGWGVVTTEDIKWRRSIHMPKKAARLFLRVTSIKAEPVQSITEKDALAEGIAKVFVENVGYRYFIPGSDVAAHTAKDAYAEYWDILNAKRGFGWKNNPGVRVIDFERIDGSDRRRLLDSLRQEA